jgi:hypothetical protein
MKIKISKSQWEQMGKKAGWRKAEINPDNSENEFRAYNLNIYQLLNYANQATMLKYLSELEAKVGKHNEIDHVREFISDLTKQSKKITHMVSEFEKGFSVGERREVPQGIDVGKESYEREEAFRQELKNKQK